MFAFGTNMKIGQRIELALFLPITGLLVFSGLSVLENREIAATIASAVEEQQAATGEISRNVQEAAQGTQEVSSNIAGVNKAAEDTGTAVNNLLSAAELSSQAETLSG